MSHNEKRFDPQRAQLLLDPRRVARWDPPRFLGRFGLEPGSTVVDVGSGPGFWTLPFADIVGPTGRVWAIDGSPELLAMLSDRNPPPQVQPLLAELPQIDVADRSADLVWLAFVYHEVPGPEALASELRRVVKAGGATAVLDWRPDATGAEGPPRAHRITPGQIIAWLHAAGFPRAEQTWQDEDAYLIEAR